MQGAGGGGVAALGLSGHGLYGRGSRPAPGPASAPTVPSEGPGRRGAEPRGMRTGGQGAGGAGRSRGRVHRGAGGSGALQSCRGACDGLGSPVPSELHSTHCCPCLLKGGNEDLLWGRDGEEAAHIRGRSGGHVLLLPCLIQGADMQQRAGGVAAQDGEGVRLAQAGWRQRGRGGGGGGRADVKRAPRGQRGPGWLRGERRICKQPRAQSLCRRLSPPAAPPPPAWPAQARKLPHTAAGLGGLRPPQEHSARFQNLLQVPRSLTVCPRQPFIPCASQGPRVRVPPVVTPAAGSPAHPLLPPSWFSP